jgi:2-keto-4-pentenoate hydratase
MSVTIMNPQQIAAAADTLATAWRNRKPIDALPSDCVPNNMDDAYAIQAALHASLGFATAGWKLGLSAPGLISKFGLSGPIPGRIYTQTVSPSPALFAAGSFNFPRFEPEFAFVLATDLPARNSGYDNEVVASAVATMHLAIEVPDSRFVNPIGMPISVGTADNMGTGAMIMGAEVPNWRDVPCTTIGVRLKAGDTVIAENLTGDMRPDPLTVLTWTVNEMSRRGEGMKAGYIISTGSHTTPTPAKPPAVITAEFDGLGSVVADLLG